MVKIIHFDGKLCFIVLEALRGVQESLTGNEWTLSLILEWFQKVEEGIFLPKRSYLRFADSKS